VEKYTSQIPKERSLISFRDVDPLFSPTPMFRIADKQHIKGSMTTSFDSLELRRLGWSLSSGTGRTGSLVENLPWYPTFSMWQRDFLLNHFVETVDTFPSTSDSLSSFPHFHSA
jgi:hypothetical protein